MYKYFRKIILFSFAIFETVYAIGQKKEKNIFIGYSFANTSLFSKEISTLRNSSSFSLSGRFFFSKSFALEPTFETMTFKLNDSKVDTYQIHLALNYFQDPLSKYINSLLRDSALRTNLIADLGLIKKNNLSTSSFMYAFGYNIERIILKKYIFGFTTSWKYAYNIFDSRVSWIDLKIKVGLKI